MVSLLFRMQGIQLCPLICITAALCTLLRKGFYYGCCLCPLDGDQRTYFHPPLLFCAVFPLLGLPLPHNVCFLLYLTCSNLFFKGSFLFQESMLCLWLLVLAAGGMVPSTPEISALQENLPFFLFFWVLVWNLSLCMHEVFDSPLPNEFIMTSEIGCLFSSGWKMSRGCFPLHLDTARTACWEGAGLGLEIQNSISLWMSGGSTRGLQLHFVCVTHGQGMFHSTLLKQA